MKKRERLPKVLWLSDIHFINGPYLSGNFTYGRLKAYFLKLIQKFDDDITHVVITGDISFQSVREEYEGFVDLFLDLLRQKYNGKGEADLVVITVPGNHDTSQNVFQFEKESQIDENELSKKN